MPDIKLKPCPWCGETKTWNILRLAANDKFIIDHMDAVFHLRSSIVFDSAEEAAEAWNRQRIGVLDPVEDPKCRGCKCLSCCLRGKAECLEGKDLCQECEREQITSLCAWYTGG